MTAPTLWRSGLGQALVNILCSNIRASALSGSTRQPYPVVKVPALITLDYVCCFFTTVCTCSCSFIDCMCTCSYKVTFGQSPYNLMISLRCNSWRWRRPFVCRVLVKAIAHERLEGISSVLAYTSETSKVKEGLKVNVWVLCDLMVVYPTVVNLIS